MRYLSLPSLVVLEVVQREGIAEFLQRLCFPFVSASFIYLFRFSIWPTAF